MTTLVAKIGLRWEAAYPILCGVAAMTAGFIWMPSALYAMHAHQWATENLFVAVFTIGTVAAGFGLTIYTFLLTTETGFIARAKRSIYYRHLLTFVLASTVLSGALALFSIPGMVVKAPPHDGSLQALYVGLWSGLCGWTAASLIRAGHLFSIFAREHH